jgi:putative addiction module killer protein
LLLYETPDGRCPWQEWFDGLKERKIQQAIDARLLRLRRGNFGDSRSLGQRVWEARLHVGPGYRIYFGEDGDNLVVLLCGGTKGSQARDIARAKRLWHHYRS